MGFFDFLTSRTSSLGKSSTELESYAHQRYHARYIVNNRDLCTIEHTKHGTFRVVDLSHHGAFIEPVADANFDSSSCPTFVDLNLCGTVIRVEVSQCQRRRNGWGLVFRHAHEHSIQNIAAFIEPLKLGSSSMALDVDPARDGLFSKVRKRFQGDGPFEVVYEKNDLGEPVFVMATLRRHHADGCVIWEKGSVITKKAADTEGARMPRTSEVDEDLVWACAAACLGMKFPEGASCAKVLHDWLMTRSPDMHLAKSS
jgi:hypothetical protein